MRNKKSKHILLLWILFLVCNIIKAQSIQIDSVILKVDSLIGIKCSSEARDYLIRNQEQFAITDEFQSIYAILWGIATSNMILDDDSDSSVINEYVDYFKAFIEPGIELGLDINENTIPIYYILLRTYSQICIANEKYEEAHKYLKMVVEMYQNYPLLKDSNNYARVLWEYCQISIKDLNLYNEISTFVDENLSLSKKYFGDKSMEYGVSLFNKYICESKKDNKYNYNLLKDSFLVLKEVENFNRNSLIAIEETLNKNGIDIKDAEIIDSNMNIDKDIQDALDAGEYDLAWLNAARYASEMESNGNKEETLKYKLLTANIFEKYREYLLKHNCTIEGYYSCWVNVAVLYTDMKNKKEALNIYKTIYPKMHQEAPELIPKLTLCMFDLLSSSNDISEYRDDFQNAVEIIIKGKYSNDELMYLNEINHIYAYNMLKHNNVLEGYRWYDRYDEFIKCLDKTTYKNIILNHYLNYADCLELCRMTEENEGHNATAISLLEKEIQILKEIEQEDDSISLKIAKCNVKIAANYHILGNTKTCKLFTDKVVNSIFKNEIIENLDYCTVLDGLSLNYWNLNQYENAIKFKEIELHIREKTELKPSVSDYGILMMYCQNDTLKSINIGQLLDNKYDSSELYMDNIYLYLADAYSKMAHKYYKENNAKLQNECTIKAEQYIHNAEKNLEYNKEWYKKINGYNYCKYKYYTIVGNHCRRFNNLDSALHYYQEALKIVPDANKENIVFLSCYLKNNDLIDKYIPEYYNGIESDIKSMLPMLGSVESASYLMHGNHSLYSIPELATWNPTNSTCVKSAYNSVLLSKELYMKYSSFASLIGQDKSLNSEYKELLDLRNEIQLMEPSNERLLALYDYEIKERELRKKTNDLITTNLNVDWETIQATLDEKEIAIEFVEYEANNWVWLNLPIKKHYIALVIDKNNEAPILVDLFDEEDIIDVYNLQPKSYSNDIGHQMYKKLWGRLHPYIKNASTVYCSPMGLLSLINLEALMDEDGVSAFEHYNLKRLSSTRELLDKTDQREIKQIALFGGINYTSQDIPIVFSIDSLNTRGNWSFLTNTLNEINTIQDDISKSSNIKLATYKGFEATESTFKKVCEEYPEIIHIASHGFYINESNRSRIPYYQSEELTDLKDNLFYSGLILAYGQDTWNNETFKLNADDGILTSYEISQMNLHNTNLVVLSACETGIGDRDFDGIVGLQRAFKMAGVQTIIMSLWKVDDEATSLMMTTFYKELLRTGSKHDAFVYAQKIVKEKYDDPYFWASFVMLD